ncbi:PREDICTED: probable G-protein coupled receptor Mth-like 3 isoform X2 [Papilio polytes]|nr:PREDICTED: probable G-protein coupled receptor Mth-like 3 isoform X2 [Papilio polytes]
MQDDEFLILLILVKLKNEADDTKIYFSAVGFLVSSFFLALVLVVYAMFSELRTLGGKVAMTCAANLLGSYSLLGSYCFLMFYSSLSYGSCVTLATLVYFFFLATFFWMNVMSFDLWWTFRGLAKCRKINRRGEAYKYCMYSIYGWGMPLCLTIFMVLMNEYPPPETVSPSIGVFKCYFGDLEKEIYMYVPMLILLICNCILFLMTVFNIWRSNKSSDMLRLKSSASVKNSINMFYIFLKMSVIMGISFVMEVVSTRMPYMKLWYITDAYNVLIGVAFFVIFVCKRRVLRLLKKKFKGEEQTKYSIGSTSKHGSSQQ